MHRLIFALALALLPLPAWGQQYLDRPVRVISGEFDYQVHGGLVPDTSGSASDTLALTGPIPAGSLLLRAWVQVVDSLDSAFHADSSTVAINVGTVTVKAAQPFRGGSGWLAAEGFYAADSSLAQAGTLGKPKVLTERGALSMITAGWPLNKGRMRVFLQYLSP
jgi:hypothetical protein